MIVARRLHRASIAAAVVAALATALVAAVACGKKGPPHPPPRLIPAPIADLRARQTDDRLVLEMTYPAVTTGGLPLPAIEALEVVMMRPKLLPGTAPAVDPATFARAASVIRRLEGADLAAATRGGELVIELDAAPGSPLAPATPAPTPVSTETPSPTATPTSTPTPTATATPTAAGATAAGTPAATAAATPTRAAPAATPLAAGSSPVLLAVRTFGSRRNESPLSNIVAIVPRAAPRPPADLAVTATAGGIEVKWTPAEGGPPVAGWDVLRRRAGESAFLARVARLGGDVLQHVDSGAAFGDHYEYTVRAVAARDPQIESGDGPVREIEYRDTFAPPAPAGLVALAEEGRIRLLWQRVEASDLAGYRLYRQENAGAEVELPRDPGAGADHTDDKVRAGATYTYRVTAVDREGNESAKSDPATAIPR